jgi:hypothetical protein
MPIDKNNLDLELYDELTMKVCAAHFGEQYLYTYIDGEQRLLPRVEDYYILVQEDIEDLVKAWLNERLKLDS